MAEFDANPILSAEQKLLLNQLSASSLREYFYLTGGTALAAFYLHHRYSDDLDLFSEQPVPIEPIAAFLRSLPGAVRSDYEQKFDRRMFLVRFQTSATLKVEFTLYPFTRLEHGRTVDGIALDSLHDILVNKLAAMTERHDAKDYADIYCSAKLSGRVDIARLSVEAEKKFGIQGIRYSLMRRFMQVPPSVSSLRMLTPLTDQELQEFFLSTARNWVNASLEENPS